MDEQLEGRLRFLREASIDVMPHSGKALLDHLLGTRQLLLEWGARPALADAGLFHSVYSTEYYGPQAIPLSSRENVRQLIGEEAELLAWMFCVMRRGTLKANFARNGDFKVQNRLTKNWISLTRDQFNDLVTMTIANSLEAFPRLSWIARRNLRMQLRRFRDIAVLPAQNVFDRLEAPWWEFWK